MPYLSENNWDLLHSKVEVAAELQASTPDNQAFIGIVAYQAQETSSRWMYLVRKFEVKREYIEKDYDIGPEQTINYRDERLDSPAAVENLLDRWLKDYQGPVEFVHVAKNDYPM